MAGVYISFISRHFSSTDSFSIPSPISQVHHSLSQHSCMNGTMTYILMANLLLCWRGSIRNTVFLKCNPKHASTEQINGSHCLGPVIRINPDEIHIDDPDYFGEVYNQTNGRVVKPPRAAEAFGPYPAVSSKPHFSLYIPRHVSLSIYVCAYGD